MTTSCTIEAEVDGGLPLEKLSELIRLRQQYMGKELTEDSVTATALNVVTSLKALTRVAPYKDSQKVPAGAYEIKESHTLYPGFYIPKGGKRNEAKIRLRTRPNNAGPRSHIKPVMLISPGERNALNAKVYVITTANKHDRFSKNVNAPEKCWYVLAPSLDSAKRFAEKHVKRILEKEGGMAQFSLAKAQAKIYNKAGGTPVRQTGGSKQFRMAADAAQITKAGGGFSSGEFSIEVFDALDYSVPALRGGSGAMSIAIMKAANKTAGIINRHLSKHSITETRIPTPFPEIAGK